MPFSFIILRVARFKYRNKGKEGKISQIVGLQHTHLATQNRCLYA